MATFKVGVIWHGIEPAHKNHGKVVIWHGIEPAHKNHTEYGIEPTRAHKMIDQSCARA